MVTTLPPGAAGDDDQRTVVGSPLSAGHALPFGHALQEFVIEALIGEGGFGIVYLARDTLLGRHVALKEYMPSNLATRGADRSVAVRSERHRETFELGLRSFVNEAQLLASFDHPSLVKVYRFWEENGTAYMVMPYYQGPTLKKWLAQLADPPDERWLLALLDPMIDALEQLHHDHCYHRDIAPDNILLLPQQGTQAGSAATVVRPLLLDFGAARRVIGDMTHALTVILKPGYAPIEQYAESAAMKQGPWTDVYALSAVLYTCVTGRAPAPSVSRIIADEMVPATIAGAGRYTPPFLEAIDAGLAVRPEVRPQSMLSLRELFAATSHGESGRRRVPVSAPSPAQSVDQATVLMPTQRSPARPEPGAASRIDPIGAAGPATVAAPSAQRIQSRPPASAGAPAAGGSRAPLFVAVSAALLLIAGAVAWWLIGPSGDSKPPDTSATVPAPRDAQAPTTSVATAPAATPAGVLPDSPAAAPPQVPVAAAPERAPFGVLALLEDIVARSDPAIAVTATADKPTLTMDRDQLKFRVRSSESGHLYVFFGDANKANFSLLFPNEIDNKNRIEAGRDVVLPRKAWEIVAVGPPGANHIVAVVSRNERDLRDVGLQHTGEPIPQFDMAVARQRWAQDGGSSFVGKAICPAAPCDAAYGARLIEINVVAPPARARK